MHQYTQTARSFAQAADSAKRRRFLRSPSPTHRWLPGAWESLSDSDVVFTGFTGMLRLRADKQSIPAPGFMRGQDRERSVHKRLGQAPRVTGFAAAEVMTPTATKGLDTTRIPRVTVTVKTLSKTGQFRQENCQNHQARQLVLPIGTGEGTQGHYVIWAQ